MSKSKKKTPIGGNGGSDKQDKRLANRKLRRRVKASDDFELTIKDVSDTWSFKKDGKSYYGNSGDENVEKWSRK